jgi:hypothetical protein
MGRSRLVAGVVAFTLTGAGGLIGVARADQKVCAGEAGPVDTVCVATTNSEGVDEDVHVISVSGHESVPMYALGFDVRVTCDDNGGTSPAEISVNAGPPGSYTVPGQCPELP